MSSKSDADIIRTSPQLRLIGSVDEAMYAEFRDQLHSAPKEGPLVIALTTLGGDPEIARTMAADVRLLREPGREIFFLGKSAVYSAGATFMAGFPVDHRYMTKNSSILIHERQISRTINLSGPLKSCTYQLEAVLNEIEHSIDIEEQGFREIVKDSKVSFEDVRDRAPENWYIGCDEAKELGLICGVI